MKRFAIILIAFLVSCFSYGQSGIPLLSADYNTFFTEVDEELWVASVMHGFNRHRGVDTKYYLLNDSLSFLEGSIIQSGVFKDNAGLLWTTTYEKLCYYDPLSDKFNCLTLQIDDHEINTRYHVFHIDNLRNLLYLRAGGYLIAFDTDQKLIHQLLGQTRGNWFTMYEDTILAAPWMNAPGFELWTLEKNVWNAQNHELTGCDQDHFARVIKAFKHNKNIWLVTTNRGIVKYDELKKCHNFFYKNNKEVSCTAAVLHDNKILMSSTNHGVLIFDIPTEQYIDHPKIEEDQINDIYVSSKGNVWMFNHAKGISSFPLLDIYGGQESINNFDKWSQIVKNGEDILLVDKSKRITIIRENVVKNILLGTQTLPIQKIGSMEVMNENEILICGNTNCFLYNIKNELSSKLYFNEGKQISNSRLFRDTLFYTADNRLYYTLMSQNFVTGKLYKEKHHGVYTIIQTCHDDVKTFSVKSSFLFIQNDKMDTLVDVKSFINKSIYDQNIKSHYVGTYSGLFKIDSLYKVTKISGNSQFNQNQTIYHLEQDKEWIYFTEGDRIGRLNKNSGLITYFYKNVYPSAPAIMVSNNKIFIAHKYLERYEIEDAFQPIKNYSLILDKCIINENDYTTRFSPDQVTKLSHNEHQLQFRFYINDWENSDLTNIQYRISTLTTSWSMISNGEVISTPYLSPGKYSMEVQGFLPDGRLTEIKNYNFQILPPWYETLWFKCLLFVLFTILVYGIYMYRLRLMKEKFRIKNELISLERSALQAQMNPHFIFNCLNSIQNYIMRNDKEQAMDYLWRFATLIRQYLNASTKDLVTLEDEISMLSNYLHLEQMRFNQVFQYHFQIAEDIDTSEIKLPPLLIQPFVENAVLHGMSSITSGGLIKVDIHKENGTLQIKVTDNGKGFDQTKTKGLRRSLGISITQKRLQYINDHAEGNYSISTKSDERGTEIGISVKIS